MPLWIFKVPYMCWAPAYVFYRSAISVCLLSWWKRFTDLFCSNPAGFFRRSLTSLSLLRSPPETSPWRSTHLRIWCDTSDSSRLRWSGWRRTSALQIYSVSTGLHSIYSWSFDNIKYKLALFISTTSIALIHHIYSFTNILQRNFCLCSLLSKCNNLCCPWNNYPFHLIIKNDSNVLFSQL